MIDRVQPISLLGGQQPGRGMSLGPPWRRFISDTRTVPDAMLVNLESLGFDRSSCRAVVGHAARDLEHAERLGCTAFLDPRPDRGTAGLLKDHLEENPVDQATDWLLVIDGLACPAIDLAGLFRHLTRPDAVILGVSELGRYCGACLLPRTLLVEVADVGFVDLKEQLLPRVRDLGFVIRAEQVASRANAVRSRQGWLASAAAWAEFAAARHLEASSLEHGGARRVGNSVVRPSANCDGAALVSSVILDDAVIGRKAVVARSIIGPGVRIKPGSVVVDTVLPGGIDR